MSDPQTPVPTVRPGSREDEVGSGASAQLAKSLGVVRHATETYSVGRFRYTNLDDAMAQARRMTKLERELM